MHPLQVNGMLTRLFDKMDSLCDELGIFRIETIGDAYLCAANVICPQPDHAVRIARWLHCDRLAYFCCFVFLQTLLTELTHCRLRSAKTKRIQLSYAFHPTEPSHWMMILVVSVETQSEISSSKNLLTAGYCYSLGSTKAEKISHFPIYRPRRPVILIADMNNVRIRTVTFIPVAKRRSQR